MRDLTITAPLYAYFEILHYMAIQGTNPKDNDDVLDALLETSAELGDENLTDEQLDMALEVFRQIQSAFDEIQRKRTQG